MSSAVSGTTLARALFANSFMLSDDRRTSRPRSSGVVRQDSATLPRGEHPFWRDRRISGGEIILSGSSGRGSPVPPVPPVPPNADLLYAAQHSARRSAGSSASSQHESPHRTPEFPEQPSTNFHEAETSQSDIFNTGDNVSRRISHTEAPSSTSLPVTSSRRILGARSSGSSSNASISPSPGKPGSLPENNRPESDKSSATSPQPRSQDSELLPNSAPSSGVPSVGSGSGLISDILDEYHSNSDSHRPLPSTSTSSIRSISSSASVSSYEGGPRPPNKRSYSGRSNRGLPSPLTEMRGECHCMKFNFPSLIPSK
jgi:hypothetical protein